MNKYDKIKHANLIEMAEKYGYQAIEPYSVKELDGVECLYVKSKHVDFDNGTYYLRLDVDNGGISLIIDKPNTIPTFERTRKTINELEKQLAFVDLSMHSVYDLIVIFSELISSNVLKPLSKNLYPNNANTQNEFIKIYTPLFCEKIMKYIIANKNDTVSEIQCLTEPYFIKTIIDKNKGKDN